MTEPGTAVGPARVLVVDDSEDARDTFRVYLEWLGYSVTTAATVEMAIVHLTEGQFDIVITDVEMAGRSGLDLITVIRSGEDHRQDRSTRRAVIQEINRTVPIIVATGHFKLDLTHIPQVEVLSKPIDIQNELPALMNRMLDERRHRLLQEGEGR